MPASEIHVVAGVLRRNGKVLIARRPADKHGAGLWEFPGGKIEPGEAVHDALRRELHEELGIDIEASSALMSLVHDYAQRRVHLKFLSVTRWQGEPHGREGQQLQWCAIDALAEVEFLAANAPVVSAISESVRR